MEMIPPPHELLGWAAAGLTLLAFSFTDILRLRYSALAANAAFIGYALTAELWPVLGLHLMLVPINVWRLVQSKRHCARMVSVKPTLDAPALTAVKPARTDLDPRPNYLAARSRPVSQGSSKPSAIKLMEPQAIHPGSGADSARGVPDASTLVA
jgi:hypothetical protein